MGTFTLELREVLETLYGTTMEPDDYQPQFEECTFEEIKYGKMIVLPQYDEIGLSYYPIFNESYRKILNGKIISHYYHQEIGQETEELFVWRLRTKMDEIMPFFNQLYESAQIEYSALDTMRIHNVREDHATGKENIEGLNKTDTTSKSGARAVNSDFPQTMLAGNADYATDGTDTNSDANIESEVEQTSESNSNSDVNSDSLTTGYQGAASDLITKYRNTLINIDTMVLAEMEDLFMMVLNNGDEYFARGTYWRY